MTAKNIIAQNEINAAMVNRDLERIGETCSQLRLEPALNTHLDYFTI
jgi:hypothetical protein